VAVAKKGSKKPAAVAEEVKQEVMETVKAEIKKPAVNKTVKAKAK
jgi:hypothetical protein